MDYSIPIFYLIVIVAITMAFCLLAAYRTYRKIANESYISRIIAKYLAGHGFAVMVVAKTTPDILHAHGLKRLLGIKLPLSSLEQLYQYVAQKDVAVLSAMAEKPEEPGDTGMMQSTIVHLKNNAIVECCVEHIEWYDNDARMFLLREITKSQRDAMAISAENDALKLQTHMHANALNYVPHPIWLRGDDLTISYCNLSYMQAIEENDEQPANGGMPELAEESISLAQSVMQHKNTQSQRMRLVINGERRLYDVTEIFISKEEGTVGIARDITMLEEAESTINQHLVTLEDLLDSSSSAMIIHGVDTRVKFYNSAYVRMWGLEETWLDSQPTFGEMLERLREMRRLPEQVNFPAFKKQRLRLFNEITEMHEELFYLPDGRTIRNIALPHSAGGILFVYEDVTDRLALERSYNTLIAVQRETLDNLHEGVVVFGEDGRLQLTNPVFLSLWDLKETDLPVGTHMSEFMDKTHELYATNNWASFKRDFVARIHARNYSNSRIERTDGAVLDCSFVPLPDGGVLLTYVDMTATTLVERSLRERNDALEAGDKLKTEFLENMSYELRSPLTSISGFAQMLQQDYFGKLSDKQQEYVEGILNSSQHLMHLINDILDLSSIEAGYMSLNLRDFDIYRLLSAMIALLGERLREFDLTATIDCPRDIGSLQADETRIRQVLFHLLSNAVQYSNRGGVITLGASRTDEGVNLIVSDNGIGISEEDQREVFKKFYQGYATTRKSGTGLGLSMVKNFVELHGGTVSLTSQVGKGTTVTCFLPNDPKDHQLLSYSSNPSIKEEFLENMQQALLEKREHEEEYDPPVIH